MPSTPAASETGQPPQAVQVHPQDAPNATLVANTHPPDWQNPEPAPIYNLVVIGGGSAGLLAVAAAAGLGAKVALIERGLLGGDCLNTGCVPSKAVIRSARILGELDRAADLGVSIPTGVTVDFPAVMARMRRVRAGISHHDSAQRFKDLGVDLFFGQASFSGPDTVTVAGATLKFKKALIATGSRPAGLPIAGLAETGYLTNETFFSLTERPDRLAVIGAGPIGSELAQAMQRLGSQVTLFDILPQVLGREDRQAAQIVAQAMRRDGLALILEARLKRVAKAGSAKVIQFEHAGREETITVDEILVAAGRVPNVAGLNLEAAGVAYDRHGIAVNDYLQSSNRNIYAAGDVGLKYQFTHTADASARIVLQNALFWGRKKVSKLTIPWCTYTDPEVAHVGLYPEQADEAGFEIETFTQSLQEIDRARADGETAGFVKIHVRKGTDQIVGATIVARHAGEMISEITAAMVGQVGLKTLAQVIHPYPTQAEAIRKIADAYNRTRLTPTVHTVFVRWFGLNRRVDLGAVGSSLASDVAVKRLPALALLAAFFTGGYFLVKSVGQGKR